LSTKSALSAALGLKVKAPESISKHEIHTKIVEMKNTGVSAIFFFIILYSDIQRVFN
jgi:hypothetical protein